MRATRGLMGALGAGGSLIAAAAVSLLLISAVFAQQGWPGLGSTLSPVELVAGVQHPHPGTKATPPRVATLRLSEHSVAPPAALHGAVGPRTIGATTHPSHTAPATPPALPPHHHVVSVTPTPPVSPPATTTPSSSAGGSPPASSTTQHSALGSAVSDTTSNLSKVVGAVNPNLANATTQVGQSLTGAADNVSQAVDQTVNKVLQGVTTLFTRAQQQSRG